MKRQPTHTVRDVSNFIMHQSIIRMSSYLSNEDLGKLVRYFFLYAENGQMPEDEQNLTIAVIFNEWRVHFEYDKKRYEAVSQKRREAGRKRWNKAHDSVPAATASPTTPTPDDATDATPMADEDMATQGEAGRGEQEPESGPGNRDECNNKEKASSPAVKAKKKAKGAPSRDLVMRRTDFYQSILPYVDQYDREMLNDFFQYWTELDKRRQRMRFEMQKTWETSKRLSTWARRENRN